MVLQVGESNTSVQQLLSEKLEQADNLRLGQLENGLKYVMLPNKLPPQRFEAHLEMHAGVATCSAELLQSSAAPCCNMRPDISAALIHLVLLSWCLMLNMTTPAMQICQAAALLL